MVPDIKHILYATDLSDSARKALAYAVGTANAHGASLTVIHVIRETSGNAELLISAFLGYESKDELRDKSRERISGEIKKRLTGLCNELGCQLPVCRFSLEDDIVEVGRPQDIIFEYTETGRYDFLVMGRHDYGIIEGLFSGSSTRSLLRHCPIPVMLIPVQ